MIASVLDLRVALRSHIITPVSSWLVSPQDFSKTAPRIFLILGVEIHYYEDKKRARPFSREKSSFSKMGTYVVF